MAVVFQTAETYFRRRIVDGVTPAMASHVAGPSFDDVRRLPAGRVAKGQTVSARVNHGRWIVDCPFCASAQLAAPSDPRFFCSDCRNVAVGGAWITVVLPPAALMTQIEAALARRPRLETMNWRPGESLGDLQRENNTHGVD